VIETSGPWRSHPVLTTLLVALTTVILASCAALPPAGTVRIVSLEAAPSDLRTRLEARLVQFVRCHAERDAACVFQMLAYPTQPREAFTSTYPDELSSRLVSLTVTAGGPVPDESQRIRWGIAGCGVFRRWSVPERRECVISAFWRDGDWYFTPPVVVAPTEGSPVPCDPEP